MSHKALNVVFPQCGCCSKRFFGLLNFSKRLAKNHAAFGVSVENTSKKHVCRLCWKLNSYSRCAKTGKVFLSKDDKYSEFIGSQIYTNFEPYHPSSAISGPLSPDGFDQISREHDELQDRLRNWAGCSRQDFLRNHRITKEIRVIKENGRHDDPADVEYALQWHCLQIGGNGLIKFFWDKHIRHHEEEYIAGYGKKGNPYYRTRRWTTTDFSGHAVAVIAEPASARRRGKATQNRNSRNEKKPRKKTEDDHRRILGLSGKVTKEDIRQAYRKAMKEYHPDKVAALGEELKKVAEQKSKEIGEAYDYFRIKYKI